VLTKEEAWDLAMSRIYRHPSEIKIVMLDEYTIERPFGWIFFFQSKKFMETGKLRDRLVGNLPILVNKHSGEMQRIRPIKKVTEQIDEYERKWDESAKP
jgi:hypothetical protein